MRTPLAGLATARDDVDRPARRPGAVEHGAAAAYDLDPLDGFERNRRELRGFEIALAEPQPVEQHQRVLVAGDAEAPQVELRVLRAREIADLQQAELRQDVAEIRRSALADVVRRDDGNPDRQVAL